MVDKAVFAPLVAVIAALEIPFVQAQMVMQRVLDSLVVDLKLVPKCK